MYLIKHVDLANMYLNRYRKEVAWYESRHSKYLILCETYSEAFKIIRDQGIIRSASPKCIVKLKATGDLYILIDREDTVIKVQAFLQNKSNIPNEIVILSIVEVEELF